MASDEVDGEAVRGGLLDEKLGGALDLLEVLQVLLDDVDWKFEALTQSLTVQSRLDIYDPNCLLLPPGPSNVGFRLLIVVRKLVLPCLGSLRPNKRSLYGPNGLSGPSDLNGLSDLNDLNESDPNLVQSQYGRSGY